MRTSHGQRAFEAFSQNTKHRLCTWTQLPESDRIAWDAAADSVYEVGYNTGFDAGEQFGRDCAAI